jgi:hypothetical protein
MPTFQLVAMNSPCPVRFGRDRFAPLEAHRYPASPEVSGFRIIRITGSWAPGPGRGDPRYLNSGHVNTARPSDRSPGSPPSTSRIGPRRQDPTERPWLSQWWKRGWSSLSFVSFHIFVKTPTIRWRCLLAAHHGHAGARFNH